MEGIRLRETRDISKEHILPLYEANKWSSAKKPNELHDGLINSHSLVTAWDGDTLVGLGNAISDGSLVVYYPHLLVLPDYQGKGIGSLIMRKLISNYQGFFQQLLLAEGPVEFYKKCGFEVSATRVPMHYGL